jgi:hypothetical protein
MLEAFSRELVYVVLPLPLSVRLADPFILGPPTLAVPIDIVMLIFPLFVLLVLVFFAASISTLLASRIISLPAFTSLPSIFALFPAVTVKFPPALMLEPLDVISSLRVFSYDPSI